MKTLIRQYLRIFNQTWDISAPAGTRLEEVLAAIPAVQDGPWQVEGQRCLTDAKIGETPLVDGAELIPASATRPVSSLQVIVTSGPQLGTAWLLAPGEHTIGRDHPLVMGDPLISRQHLILRLQRGEVTITDAESANGTRLRGEALAPMVATSWHLGDHLYVGGSELLLTLDTPSTIAAPLKNGHYARPARVELTPPPRLKLEWPAAPMAPGRHPLRLIAALLPLPIGLAAAYFFHSTMLLLMMAASPLIMLFTAFDDRRQGKRQSHADMRNREAKLHRNAARMQQQLTSEKRYRRARFLSIDPLLQAAAGHGKGLDTASAHWPLELRLGVGRCYSPSFVQLENAEELHPFLDDVPVTCEIAPGAVVHLACADDIRPNVLTQVVSELIVHGAPGVRPPCVASPTLNSQPDDRTDLVVRVNIDAILSAFAQDQPGTSSTGVLIIEQDAALTAQKLEDLVKSGFAVVWIGDRCPGAADQIFTLREGCRSSHGPNGAVFTVDLPQLEWIDSIATAARRWEPRAYPLSVQGTLPGHLTPEELGIDTAAHWDDGPNMNVPVGIDSQGEYTLNLERFGPHALVAGTTGSGKSEFLLAYLRGLLALNSPDHVSAILIDYKGGATFGPLTTAPHVVGVICDLDVGLAERALIGLRAEIHRREKLLRSHGVASFAAYQALEDPKDVLPRLFVIVDEFRVLAEELPEFVSGLIRMAAVGRSLGIHLILATQRPGGVVTADMRANIDLRVCLRVRERADSIDVLESPVAAHIDRMTPGRTFVAVAGENPREVQTMYTSLGRDAGSTSLHVHPVTATGKGTALPHHVCPGCLPRELSARSDLELTVDACRQAAQSFAVPHRPVLPALGEHIDIEAVTSTLAWNHLTQAQCTLDAGDATNNQVIAVVDLPELQAQPGMEPDRTCHVSICGAAKTGRSNAARVIAGRLDPSGTQTWWITSDDEKSERLIRPDDAQAVANLMGALMAGTAPRVLVIDGWEQLYETLLLLNHGLAADDFISLISRAHRLPMQIIVTGGRALMTSKISALFEMRFIMRQNDVGEYSLAGLRPQNIPAAMPPGRALVLPYGRQVHFVEASPDLTSECRQVQTEEQVEQQ